MNKMANLEQLEAQEQEEKRQERKQIDEIEVCSYDETKYKKEKKVILLK